MQCGGRLGESGMKRVGVSKLTSAVEYGHRMHSHNEDYFARDDFAVFRQSMKLISMNIPIINNFSLQANPHFFSPQE